jgi:hypothetical protein
MTERRTIPTTATPLLARIKSVGKHTTLPNTLPTTALSATGAPTLAASHTTRYLSRNSVRTVPRYPSLRVGWKIEIPGHKEDRTYELHLF